MHDRTRTTKPFEISTPNDRAVEKTARNTEAPAIDDDYLLADSEVFRRMFKDHSAVMYMVDLSSFAIIDANQAALNFYGYDYETMLTKRVPDLNITPEAEIRAEIERALTEGRSH